MMLMLLYAFSLLAEKESFNMEMVEERLVEMESIVPMMHLSKIKNRVNKHIVDWEPYTTKLIERSFMYFPIIEHILDEKQLPEELKFLTVIESELQPKTNYSTGAGGFWQLMPRTARSLGLSVNSEVDERYEIYSSTEAALSYVVELYDRFEDWSLVLAAYNCGPTKVSRLIREKGSSEFQDIYAYLPSQTRAYFDKFLAYQYVFEYYDNHDIRPFLPSAGINEFVKIDFPENMSIKSIADQSGLDLMSIRKWNPHIKSSDNAKISSKTILVLPYNVNLAEGKSYRIVERDVNIDEKGNLEELANLIGCLPEHINQWNKKKEYRGAIQTIHIPKNRVQQLDKYLGLNDIVKLEANRPYVQTDYGLGQFRFGTGVEDFMTYNMQSQDDLRTIAYRYGVTVDSIMAANQDNQEFRSGSIIRIPKK